MVKIPFRGHFKLSVKQEKFADIASSPCPVHTQKKDESQRSRLECFHNLNASMLSVVWVVFSLSKIMIMIMKAIHNR